MSLLLRTTKLSHRATPSNALLTPRFFALPPLLRSRAFHASAPCQNLFLTTIHASHDALTSLHTLTGLPWVYTLPLFAVLLRATVVLPISIYSRRATQKQVTLTPLVAAWRHTLQHETMREVGHLGPNVSQKTLLLKLRRKRAEIFRRHGCGMWKNFLALLQLPIFLSVMEAIRKMCGSNQGLLGMMMGNDLTVATGVEDVTGVITGEGLLTSAISIPLETSLATEGALWFPNLLLADPQLALPFILSATILLNIFSSRARSGVQQSKWQKRLMRSMGLAALAIGPLMINVPSALLVYWISSSGAAVAQAVLLDKLMPMPKAVKACEPRGKRGLKLGGNGDMKERARVVPKVMRDPALHVESYAPEKIDSMKGRRVKR